MPKAAPAQTNFNAGEFSPLVQGRVDSPRYKQGLATCLNYIPTLQGPLVRKPGTKYLNNVKNSAQSQILVEFKFSQTQAYILEFGDGYVRFYANNGQVLSTGTVFQVQGSLNINTTFSFWGLQGDTIPPTGYSISASTSVTAGTPLELVTPYSFADLPLLRWAQSADTLYLVHPNYPPMKLQRQGQTSWSLKQIYFQDGPYLPLNSNQTLGDSTQITLTASGTSSAISLLAGPTFTITNVTNASGNCKITTSTAHGFTPGQKVVVQNVTGTVGAAVNSAYPSANGGFWTVLSVPTVTTLVLANSTFSGTYTSGGFLAPAVFLLNGPTSFGSEDAGRPFALIEGGKRYWGTITQTGDGATANAFIDPSNVVPGTTAATGWFLGAWSRVNGYPSSLCFHQNRLVFAGSANNPQQVNASVTGNFENFAISDQTTLAVTASNALQEDLVSSDVNLIQWIKSTAQGLLAGTLSSEWAMSPSSQSEALTPTNFNAVQTSSYGADRIDAVQLGNAVIYAQVAKRKIREMNYFFQVGTFRSTDLTELSEHITLPTVIKLVTQKQPQPLTWALRSDGQLVSLTYDRDDVNLRSGWARYQLGGQSDAAGSPPLVQSIAVIPSPDLSFDQLWMTVKRWINGASVITVEYMTKIFDDSVLQEDSYHFDCGATYDAPLTITAISHATTAVVTSAAHGLTNGQTVRLVGVVGLNLRTTDVDGNVTITNLVNEKTFLVAGVTTNTFQLTDFSGVGINSTAYSIYISGGQARKLVSTISNLTWLENETVSVLADGAIHPDCVVSNSGAITLQYPAAKVQIGYSYNSDGQLLRLEAGAADGSSIGKLRRNTRMALLFHRIGDFLMGRSFTKLVPVRFQTADIQQADQATPLFSGIHRDSIESEYSFDGPFCFRQNTGLPGMVQLITTIMDETDV